METNALITLRGLIRDYTAIDDRIAMAAMDEEIRAAIPPKQNLAGIIPELLAHEESTRTHLLCLLASVEQKELLQCLREIALHSDNYLNVTEALAGLLLTGEDHRDAGFARLKANMPPCRDPWQRFLRDIEDHLPLTSTQR